MAAEEKIKRNKFYEKWSKGLKIASFCVITSQYWFVWEKINLSKVCVCVCMRGGDDRNVQYIPSLLLYLISKYILDFIVSRNFNINGVMRIKVFF